MEKHKSAFLALMILFVIGIGFLHEVTPGDQFVFHEIYRRLGYFPIVVAAILYGVSGGLIVAGCTVVAFIPHLRHFYHIDSSIYLSELPEIALYLAAGYVTGAIAGREKKLRVKYQDLSEKLENSYNRLHQETALLIEVEEQLRASQKLSALGQISASLAHEIKNPLAGIRGAAETFLDEFPPGHSKREFVEILLKEISRLSATVDNVLHFSRDQQHHNQSSLPQLEKLENVVNRVVKLLDNQFRKNSIDVVVELSKDTRDFMVDGDKMVQVFMNLLLNSCESITGQGRIQLSSEKNDKEVSVHFADNGPGISEKERENIFKPFYSNRLEGTGLGLTISSRIVERYGGHITLSDSRKGGACFTVILPLDKSS